jgi:hypothetical protein
MISDDQQYLNILCLIGRRGLLSLSCTVGRTMAQAVSYRPLTTEARVRYRVSPCGICGAQSGTGIGFSPSSSVSPVNVIPPWLSLLMYHVGDEQ